MAEPAEVFSLAEYLAEEMQARGWYTEDVAVRMGTKRGAAMDLFYLDTVMCIPNEKVLLEDDFFEALGRAFDASPSFFKTLHETWNKYPDRQSKFEVPERLFGPTSRRACMRLVQS